MQVISTIEELDVKLRQCDEATTDAELRNVFAGFVMAPIGADGDPFSPEYRQGQMDLYAAISGRQYGIENEHVPMDLEYATRRPFPYMSDSLEVTGTQLLSIGAMLRRMKLPPGARILEFGPGWGNTTLAMAHAGYSVTAVDVSAEFCELIRRRAGQIGVSIEVVNSDFMWAEQVTEPYDAVVFFECFHHCDDHMRLLRALRVAVKDTGHIYFGGEPITDAFPIPWGLRLDGESLWAIRKHGWLELGFTEQYFVEALERTGWAATKHQSHDYFGANVWEASKVEPKIVEKPHPEVLAMRTELNELRTTLHTQAIQITSQADTLHTQAIQITSQADTLHVQHATIEAFRNSTSWKLTAPLRAIVKLIRR